MARCAAEASEASRSAAAGRAPRAACSPVPCSPQAPFQSGPSTRPGIAGRTYRAGVHFPQLPNQKTSKIHFPFPSTPALQPHRIAHECFPDKTLSPSPFGLSAPAHPARSPAFGIAQEHPAGCRRLGTIHFRWCALSQSLVGTNPIVAPCPAVGPPLLPPPVRRGRLRRLGFQHPVHLFVGSVLLRMPWRDEFDPNPQRRPPGAQARHPFVAALAAHAKTPTQLRHALLCLQRQLHKLQPSHHRRDLFPRHGPQKAQKGKKICHPSPCPVPGKSRPRIQRPRSSPEMPVRRTTWSAAAPQRCFRRASMARMPSKGRVALAT